MNAGLILDSFAREFVKDSAVKYLYVSLPTPPTPELLITRAVCFETPCVMETNIRLLPRSPKESAISASDIINHVARQFSALGSEAIERYLKSSPSFAVDGNPTTSFRSVDGESSKLA